MTSTQSPHRSLGSTPFIVVDENSTAHQLLQSLPHPKRSTDGALVFVYGPSGVGKTHLLHCRLIGWLRQDSAFVYEETTGRDFNAQFRQALKTRKTGAFQDKFATVDLLVCEDIDSLKGQEQTQWQLMHCLDEVLARSGYVLLTSKRSPGQLTHFLPRLLSRLLAGHCIPMPLPSYSSRLQFVRLLASARQIALPTDSAKILAQSLQATPADLTRQLERLDQASRTRQIPITTELTRTILQSAKLVPRPSLAQIAKTVAVNCGISLRDLRSRSRVRRLVRARQIAIFLSRVLAGESYGRIARYFGLTHHSTAVYSYKCIQKLIAVDPEIRSQLALIELGLGQNSSQ